MLRSSLLPLAAATAAFALPAAALADGVTITSYGHSALLINGGGASVLVNPFKAVACAAGLKEPRIKADVVLASSLLLDEGAPVAQGRFLASPGGYSIKGLRFLFPVLPASEPSIHTFWEARIATSCAISCRK
ncbi:MAG: MBL fold metallo-hydrolase, partial [Prochlorococcaceae cyanobacterium]